MIVVRIELWSARTGKKTELARMKIWNDEETTRQNERRGSYWGETYRGRTTEDLNKEVVTRRGRVEDFPRKDLHLWYLVAKMLKSMGYT